MIELALLSGIILAFVGGVWLGWIARGKRAVEEANEAVAQERLHRRNQLLDSGRRTDARPDNGPPSRIGRIRYTGERPSPGDKPPTRM